jgi:hypothetical protein
MPRPQHAAAPDHAFPKGLRRRSEPAFGCRDCADEQNHSYGHVTPVGHSDGTGSILKRCPRCSMLYEAIEGVGTTTIRLSTGSVQRLFPGAF